MSSDDDFRSMTPIQKMYKLELSADIPVATLFLISFPCLLCPAHDGKMKERIADYNKINSELNLPREVNANTYGGSSGELLIFVAWPCLTEK